MFVFGAIKSTFHGDEVETRYNLNICIIFKSNESRTHYDDVLMILIFFSRAHHGSLKLDNVEL